jgi:O-antigen/teichoic acid export membrane protein
MLREQTALGVVWKFAQQLGQRGATLAATLFLAYFLVPADFGLMAMLAVFTNIANNVMDAGFRQALIRKPNASETDVNTVFYANIALALILYAVLFAAAPWIGDFYEESRLPGLLRALGAVIVIQSLQTIQVVELSRSLNFKLQALAAVPATIVGGATAVLLAYLGLGVWALIAQMIVSSIVLTVGLWIRVGWRPRWVWSADSLHEFLGFSTRLFLTSLLEQVFHNLYIVVIAKYFAAAIAGYYFFAQKIKELLSNQLVASIQTVTYPALSRLQDDNLRLKAGVRRVVQVTMFLLPPVVLFVAALAPPLFEVLLPATWLPAVPYLQLMCIAHVLHPLHSINLNVLKIKGRSDLYLNLEFGKRMISAFALYLAFPYGIEGILFSQIILSLLFYLPNGYAAISIIDYSVREQVSDSLPSLSLAGGIAVLTYVAIELSIMSPLAELLAFGLAAVLSYWLGAAFLKLEAFVMAKDIVRKLPIFGARQREA